MCSCDVVTKYLCSLMSGCGDRGWFVDTAKKFVHRDFETKAITGKQIMQAFLVLAWENESRLVCCDMRSLWSVESVTGM